MPTVDDEVIEEDGLMADDVVLDQRTSAHNRHPVEQQQQQQQRQQRQQQCEAEDAAISVAGAEATDVMRRQCGDQRTRADDLDDGQKRGGRWRR